MIYSNRRGIKRVGISESVKAVLAEEGYKDIVTKSKKVVTKEQVVEILKTLSEGSDEASQKKLLDVLAGVETVFKG